MKLPFVSREAYDYAVAQADYFRAKCETWETRYVEAVGPKPVTAAVQTPPRVHDPLTMAIAARAGTNGALRGHLATWAKTERAKGTPEAEIVRMVADWDYRPEPAKPDEPTKQERREAEETMATILDGF